MTGYLPPGMKDLFAPRPELPFAKPLDKSERHRKLPIITGVADLVGLFEDPAVAAALPKPETIEERHERVKAARKARYRRATLAVRRSDSRKCALTCRRWRKNRRARHGHSRRQRDNEEANSKGLAAYEPAKNPDATMDPYKTLFVGRLSYEVTEKRLLV